MERLPEGSWQAGWLKQRGESVFAGREAAMKDTWEVTLHGWADVAVSLVGESRGGLTVARQLRL